MRVVLTSLTPVPAAAKLRQKAGEGGLAGAACHNPVALSADQLQALASRTPSGATTAAPRRNLRRKRLLGARRLATSLRSRSAAAAGLTMLVLGMSGLGRTRGRTSTGPCVPVPGAGSPRLDQLPTDGPGWWVHSAPRAAPATRRSSAAQPAGARQAGRHRLRAASRQDQRPQSPNPFEHGRLTRSVVADPGTPSTTHGAVWQRDRRSRSGRVRHQPGGAFQHARPASAVKFSRPKANQREPAIWSQGRADRQAE